MNILHYIMAKFEMMRTLRRDERGVTAMEYALIAALVAIVIITALTLLGSNLSQKFANIAGAIGTGASTAGK